MAGMPGVGLSCVQAARRGVRMCTPGSATHPPCHQMHHLSLIDSIALSDRLINRMHGQGRVHGGGGGAGGGAVEVRACASFDRLSIDILRCDDGMSWASNTIGRYCQVCDAMQPSSQNPNDDITNPRLGSGPRWRSARRPCAAAPFTSGSRYACIIANRVGFDAELCDLISSIVDFVVWGCVKQAEVRRRLRAGRDEATGDGDGGGGGDREKCEEERVAALVCYGLGSVQRWVRTCRWVCLLRDLLTCTFTHTHAAPPATRCGSWPASSCSGTRFCPCPALLHLELSRREGERGWRCSTPSSTR